jgi:hypothetical protein
MHLRAKDKTVLCVDDEEAIRELLAVVLRRRGYVVRCASSAADALNIVQAIVDDQIPLTKTATLPWRSCHPRIAWTWRSYSGRREPGCGRNIPLALLHR